MNISDLKKTQGVKYISDYVPGLKIKIKDKMQNNYEYMLSAPYGSDFDEDFSPQLSPGEMLKYGIFEGKYLNDCYMEFPFEWYQGMLGQDGAFPEKADIQLNYFKIKSRQSLKVWREKGWISQSDPDVRGWFQWYCRYYIGRREPELDKRQIKRWRAFRRHVAQVAYNCDSGDLYCRPKQRQALLQWGYNPFI